MLDIAQARSLADFQSFALLLQDMAAWDAAETRAHGQDPAALLAECYGDSAEELHRQFTAPGAAMFLARHGGELAGCAGFSRAGPGLAEVEKVFVRPAFRGLGLGFGLLRCVMTAMIQGEYQAARLETATFMTDAIALYRRFGFSEIPAFRPPVGNLGAMSVFLGCTIPPQAEHATAAVAAQTFPAG